MNQIKKILFKLFNAFTKGAVILKIHKVLPFIEPIYDQIFTLLCPNKSKVAIIQGSKMYLDITHKHRGLRRTFQAYSMNKVHEPTTTHLFKKNIHSGDVVVDFGANIGYFTLLFARLVGKTGKVFAFEPEPTNFKYLKTNIGLNNYTNVMAFQKAVSNKNGKTQLYICDYDTGHHTINQYGGIEAYSQGRKTQKKSIDIDTVRLDDFLSNKTKKIDVMKIDAEGAEALAIQGMDKLLKDNKDIIIFMEYFPLLLKKMGNDPKELIEKLMYTYNFKILVIPDDYNAKHNSKMILIKSPPHIINMCKGGEHINLILSRKDVNI